MIDPDFEERDDEAKALQQLFKQKATLTQEEFGARFNIGNQSMVSQYLTGRRPLNLEAALNFAGGLKVNIEEFSPRIAKFARSLVKDLDRFQPGHPDGPKESDWKLHYQQDISESDWSLLEDVHLLTASEQDDLRAEIHSKAEKYREVIMRAQFEKLGVPLRKKSKLGNDLPVAPKTISSGQSQRQTQPEEASRRIHVNRYKEKKD